MYIYPVFPWYPLLPPPYLFTYGPLPPAQCLHLCMPPPDTAYPTVATPSLLMTANGAGPRIAREKTLLLYSQCQHASHTLCSQVRSRSSKDALTPGQAGVAAPAKRAVPGSRAGAVALPYPLKKENGKILYECNVCGKNFGQLSNLKVSVPWVLLSPPVSLLPLTLLPESSPGVWQPLLDTSWGHVILRFHLGGTDHHPGLVECTLDSDVQETDAGG